MMLLAAAAVIAAASGCVQPQSGRITAADLASVSPAFGQLPPDLVIGFAPQPGYTRSFTAAEQMQWLERHGVQSRITESVCVQWRLASLDAAAVRAAMLAELPSDARLDVIELSQYGAPSGRVVFPKSSLRQNLWRGYVVYAPDTKFDIWARVDLRVPFTRVVAASDIPSGGTIDASQLRVETGEGPPSAKPFEASIEHVAGRVARRALAAGTAIDSSVLQDPIAIRKGDAVRVTVQSGAARLRFDATALTAGAAGEAVSVKIADSGKVIRARAISSGVAVVEIP